MRCYKISDGWVCDFETLHGNFQTTGKTEQIAKDKMLQLKESYISVIDKMIEKQEK